ncbi:hypothetical protein BH11BAC6_BH11BAC6_11030 [soil metagenome]
MVSIMKLSVIIVNYNVKYFLEQCLCSVQQAIIGLAAEVLVIDNCSSDNSVAYLKHKFPFVKFIINDANMGFAKANNVALQQSNGSYILFLNPDTIIAENTLKECLSFFETHTDAGAVGVKMLDGNGFFLPESKRAFPSPFVSFFKLSGLSVIFPQSSFFNRYALGALDKNKVHEVDVLCGAFMMAEKKLLFKLNGFDETFFMYGEDIDLSYRIQQLGKKNYYFGHISIIHFKGESAGKNKLKYTRMFYKAMHVFVSRHYTGVKALLLKVFLQLGIFIRSLLSLIALPFKTFLKKFSSKNVKENIFLIGDGPSTTEAEKIILAHRKNAISSSVIIEKKEQPVFTKGAEIVFCTGTFTYLETIKLTERNAGMNIFKWHGLNTKSIVGSTHKKYTGTVYFADDTVVENTADTPQAIAAS